ncbi:arrestin domain containing protein [Cordyceps fumosorosea ARSEF 2679]|uniref:Arrestin domain containing protein n=1 Tax=Cordyceps fumosorosea (strain ARSEF 2679) TaxID=1081104 RepID=A0A167Q4R5_CORFA|nr:arrestin domain containing protein [Cordyceps fumosorosea ARSEF 2679]OAA57288.1 arrestin domain containing protein [Cordyceps fumosorosea ARSEF 2679]
MTCSRPQSSQGSVPWVIAEGGNISHRSSWLPSPGPDAQTECFPAPLIGPRRTRPQAIHVLSFPSGYIPRDLRPSPTKSLRLGIRRERKQDKSAQKTERRIFLLRRFSAPGLESACQRQLSRFSKQANTAAATEGLRPPQGTSPPPSSVHEDEHRTTPLPEPSLASGSILSVTEEEHIAAPPAMTSRRRGAADTAAYRLPTDTGYLSSIMNKSAVTSVTEIPKPVASGSGVTCSILLAEQNVFLYGFEHDNHSRMEHRSGTALLRGRLRLNVTKNVKLKAVQLKLVGRARTEWPEGIPPLKQDLFEEESLRTQVLTFFNAMTEGWENEYGNQCTYSLKSSSNNSSNTNLALPATQSHRASLSSKEMKRLSLQTVQSRSFGKSDYSVASVTQAKGYKVFYPGTYDYSFELPIDFHQLETTKLQYGSVKWELHATVDRAGAFKPNLHGVKEVSIVRLPDQMSQEMSEPISISRQWENQLHYDIVISGKSFPIGSKIPIAFKLTPLDKVHIHKLKVFLTESTEYWTNDKRVTRKDPGRKILLLEKVAGKPLDSHWRNSSIRTLRGGELSPQQRQEARETARRRRVADASRKRVPPEPLPEPTENMLGELELGLESMWGATEIEANVQIPTCEMMAKNKDLRLHPDCSWKNVNVYHWIKVVMRISRLDPEDPSGTKRRHFEISIDSPFTVLDCRATQANTFLPTYTGPATPPDVYRASCGCPDAHVVATDASPSASSIALAPADCDAATDVLPAAPRAAHVHQPVHEPSRSGNNGSPDRSSRPIHLLRAPSFSPPSFDEDTAPPPMLVDSGGGGGGGVPAMTPPPTYDTVVGTPSVDGLADYFARLADYFARLADYGFEGEEDESDGEETPPRILERSGRVNVAHPRTPGGRMPSRSLEIARPPVNLNLEDLAKRRNVVPAAAASTSST